MSSEEVVPIAVGKEIARPSSSPAPLTTAPVKPPIPPHATIYPGPMQQLDAGLVNAVRELEANLEMRVWLLCQQGDPNNPFDSLTPMVYEAFFSARNRLERGKNVCLLLNSGGGLADEAYKIANLLRVRCDGFVVVIPRYAKSAATLLALGAKKIIMHEHAELGPLDAQLHDPDREEYASALNEVQALDRLHASGLLMADSTMRFLLPRTGKRVETLLPMVLRFVADTMKPLYEKIDAVHLSKMSRILKVGEEYAVRLLEGRFTRQEAEMIARSLVHTYPEHGFIIDKGETECIGKSSDSQGIDLKAALATSDQAAILEKFMPFMSTLTALGPVEGLP